MNEESKWAKDQLSREQAIAFAESKEWENMTSEQIVRFQLFQKCLCMPFEKFHKAISEVFGRPVYTHEFASRDNMVLEYLGEREAPTLQEIIDLIPEEKRIIIGL